MNDLIKKYQGKRVLVQGLGVNNGGINMVKFFAKAGAIVRVTDLKTAEQLKDSLTQLKDYTDKYKIEYVLGEHRLKDFAWADIVVRNPAVKPGNKFIEYAKSKGAEVIMEIALFMQSINAPVIGVTGTKGKSTTTSLIYDLLKNDSRLLKKHNFFLAGNIGIPALANIDKVNNKTIVVLEISSFQAVAMRQSQISPHVSVITNIFKEHLNWHPSFKHYIDSKASLFDFQTDKDYAVIFLDNKYTIDFVNRGKAKKIGVTTDITNIPPGVYKRLSTLYYIDLTESVIYRILDINFKTKDIKKELVLKVPTTNLELKGDHNLANIALAIAVANIYGISKESILKTLRNFKGLYGRQMFVREINGVKFYNDTAATHVVSVEASIKRFAKEFNKDGLKHLILIMGGVDKGLDYARLSKLIEKNVKAIVLLDGSASEKIKEVVDKLQYPPKVYAYYRDFDKAIKKAYNLARDGDAVILAPTASSFNMFANEWDRGHKFDKIVTNL